MIMPNSTQSVALITGAARRIGRAIALELAQIGYSVAIHYHRHGDAAEDLVRNIVARGGHAIALNADLSNPDAVAKLIPTASAQLGPLQLLVNNASLFERDDIHTATIESWAQHLDVNLRAPFFLSQAFAAQLPPNCVGNIINLIDMRVWKLTPHFASYTISKSGLWTLTQTLAMALAPRIRVNGIGPGPSMINIRQTEEQFAQQIAATPLRRGAPPEEIASAVRFILNTPSLTGQMLALDGGQHLPSSAPTNYNLTEE